MDDQDLDELLNVIVPFAKRNLSRHGGFDPFGGSIDRDGLLIPADAGAADVDSEPDEAGADESAEPEVLAESMLAGLRERARRQEIRAAALCLDMHVIPPGRSDGTDAIAVWFEHASGRAIDVFVPYTQATTGAIEYGEPIVARGGHEIFPRPR